MSDMNPTMIHDNGNVIPLFKSKPDRKTPSIADQLRMVAQYIDDKKLHGMQHDTAPQNIFLVVDYGNRVGIQMLGPSMRFSEAIGLFDYAKDLLKDMRGGT